MQFAIGTGGLKPKFDEEYWKIFVEAIENDNYVHTALNYLYVDQYFQKANLENIKTPKVIVKIEINKNPIKKFINIKKQIDMILNSLKINKIDTLQICNNPSANILNLLLLKGIFKDFIKKGIIENLYLESFEPFSNNLTKLVDDEFFKGFIFKFNCIQRGTSKNFFQEILKTEKKIISISPLAGGKFFELISSFDQKYNDEILKIMKENNFENYIDLNIAFLKYFRNIECGVFGTKKYRRYLKIISSLDMIEPLKDHDVEKILSLQDQYKIKINY